MKQVNASPNVQPNDWRQLVEVLRDMAQAINQAAQGFLYRSVSVNAAYSAGLADLVIYVSPSGTMTVTLPNAKDMLDKVVTVKRKNNTTHIVTIQASSGQIDGAASTTLTTAYQATSFHSDGANYYTV
jgi:hypothetical protein